MISDEILELTACDVPGTSGDGGGIRRKSVNLPVKTGMKHTLHTGGGGGRFPLVASRKIFWSLLMFQI